MSYRIEYDWVAVRLPKQRIESAYEDHFILASLGGDNNIYSRDGKRPRSWSLSLIHIWNHASSTTRRMRAM